jgi:tetratricopeptide (TPR) repeat protein
MERMAKLNEGTPSSRSVDLRRGSGRGSPAAFERLRPGTADGRQSPRHPHLRAPRPDPQLAQAERSFRTAQALAATLGADALALACNNDLGELFRQRGELGAAEQCYRSVVRFARERNWEAHAAVAHLNLSALLLEQGRPREARKEVEHAEHLLASSPQHWAWLHVGVHRALVR